MKLEQLRNLLSSLDDDIEVRVSVQEYKVDAMRDFRYEDGRSQSLEGINIKGDMLILKGDK
ncbi:hypothetical protein UAW_00265 [Enterococcus haemoperoxidus ATCC BAA-382]|uniref:Uncharacterized protein n=1 Tax=Enterococcus haemoperoxidus ATCC BAA-382 TaxID=1158608 RepID=R2QXJ0_9ENTE|nr:hypothetical protein [Enterococcus haemoperoxidus]EOI00091.1 hypothetical protein UAW_00265 [Enterococcus haemoperoxidus ATCC BAA-382]EOT63143.1 hypothetical protein I583_02146 [Enterococcus haemoperoxidus ATCC BAA-382]OJG53587.1 hypothetical protein RV06_GL000661 [Enterococcus haemoperoxidus]